MMLAAGATAPTLLREHPALQERLAGAAVLVIVESEKAIRRALTKSTDTDSA